MSQSGSAVDTVGDGGEGTSLLDIFVNAKEKETLNRALLKNVLGPAKVDKDEAEPARYRIRKHFVGADFLENVEEYRPGGFYPVDIGGILLGKYKVCQKLGHGRHATVWLCRNTIEPEWRVLKIFKAGCSQRAAESYEIAVQAHHEITEFLASETIRVPDRMEWMESKNGKHICFVLSLYGPKITYHELEKPSEQSIFLQRVLVCLRELHKADIGHGGVHPGNILQDVDNTVYKYSEEEMLKWLGKPTRHRIEAAESSGKGFAKAHAPKYLTQPTQGLGRLKLRPTIALTDVAVAIVLNDDLRNKWMARTHKINVDLWGFCFTTMRLGQRRKLNALPWQPVTARRNPGTYEERLEHLMDSPISVCDSILWKKDMDKEYYNKGSTHGVDAASLASLNEGSLKNLALQKAVEHFWEDPRDLWLFGDLLEETRNFRIRDPPPFKEGNDEDDDDDDDDEEEEEEDPDTQVKPGETANEYNTLKGKLKPLAQSPFRGDRAVSRFRDDEVQGKAGPTRSNKKSAQPEKNSKERSLKKKAEEKKAVKSKEKSKENPKGGEKKPEEGKSKEKKPEKAGKAAPSSATSKPEEDETDEVRTIPVHLKDSDKTGFIYNGKSSGLFENLEEQEQSKPSASSRDTGDSSGVHPAPEVGPESEPEPEPDPEQEQKQEHEKTPKPEPTSPAKSPTVRREAFQYVFLGLVVMFAVLTVVFATLFFWARPPPAAARSALKSAGELLYLQSRRLSPQTTFFEGVVTSSGAEGSARDADARVLFQGLDFLENEFRTLSD